MITLDRFLTAIAENVARVHAYKLGCDGSNGDCDCIGLIIGAVRLAGLQWPWTHSSNYTARYLLANGIHKDAPLQLGDLVFKGRSPGESGYDLPSRYRDSGDVTDYYHVGVVTSVDPLCITHCTGVPGGIKRDTTRGKWQYSGWLKLVERGVVNMATIISPNGGKVNLRKEPQITAGLVAQLSPGTEVEILGTTNTGWTRVQYGTKSGYVMSQYLDTGDATTAKDAQITQVRALLQQAIALLDEMG